MVTTGRAPGRLQPARLRAELGLSRERMARLFDVSARTIERWEERDQAPANALLRGRMVQLRRIVDLGLQVYTPEGLHAFLTEPQPRFGDRTGLELIRDGEGEDVYGELCADYEGGGY